MVKKVQPKRVQGKKPVPKTGPPDKKSVSLPSCPPVVTVMGHINHGKTTILDSIRQTNVAAQETGGITQHIGAYQVEVTLPDSSEKKKITFIDTPGHEAFTKMRARGAMVTDIVVLVVAADDGVMPQTREAIEHARAAGVPIIVAINKIDLASADANKVKEQLVEAGVLLEELGGDIPAVEVSAKEKKGITELLEMILLVAELADLKADPGAGFQGGVIESRLDPQKGPLATILVKQGTLRVGDEVCWEGKKEKVRALFDDRRNRVTKALPATPVEILGLSSVPPTGVVIGREPVTPQPPSIKQRKTKRGKTINLVVKADTEGTKEVVSDSLKSLSLGKKTVVEIIFGGTGPVSQSDVFLAKASEATIVGFNVDFPSPIAKLAEAEGVEVKLYNLIYKLLEDLEKGFQEKLAPKPSGGLLGKGEVVAQFEGTKAKIAGTKIVLGSLRLGERVRLIRDQEVVGESRITTMRHLKEAIKVAKEDQECGLTFDPPLDFEIKDIIECYRTGK